MMTDTSDEVRFQDRLRNWGRVMQARPSNSVGSFLGTFADFWRSEDYKARPTIKTFDVFDAFEVEKCVAKLEEDDRELLRDWYVRNLSIGKIARLHGLFFNAVERNVRRSEKRLHRIIEPLDK